MSSKWSNYYIIIDVYYYIQLTVVVEIMYDAFSPKPKTQTNAISK